MSQVEEIMIKSRINHLVHLQNGDKVWVKRLPRQNIHGGTAGNIYDGDDHGTQVTLASDLRGVELAATVIHEMMHYHFPDMDHDKIEELAMDASTMMHIVGFDLLEERMHDKKHH